MVLTVTAVLLILACLEMNSVKASLWDLHLFICKGPQTNTRFQAKSCFQSHKVLFAICPRTSKLSTTLPFFLSVPIAWYKPFCWQIYQVLTWTFFRETDFSLVHFHNFRRVFFFFFSFFSFFLFPSCLNGAVCCRWVHLQIHCTGEWGECVELTVNQQLVLFLVCCSVKGTMLNQLETVSNWFQWAVHVEIWTLETVFLQPCNFWLFTSYLFSPRGVRLKCYSWCWYNEWKKRHCRILQAGEESKQWQCKWRITMPGNISLNMFLGLVESETRLKHLRVSWVRISSWTLCRTKAQ